MLFRPKPPLETVKNVNDREYLHTLVQKHAKSETVSFFDMLKSEVCDELFAAAKIYKQKFNPTKILEAKDIEKLQSAIDGNRTLTVALGKPVSNVEVKHIGSKGYTMENENQKNWNAKVTMEKQWVEDMADALYNRVGSNYLSKKVSYTDLLTNKFSFGGGAGGGGG